MGSSASAKSKDVHLFSLPHNHEKQQRINRLYDYINRDQIESSRQNSRASSPVRNASSHQHIDPDFAIVDEESFVENRMRRKPRVCASQKGKGIFEVLAEDLSESDMKKLKRIRASSVQTGRSTRATASDRY